MKIKAIIIHTLTGLNYSTLDHLLDCIDKNTPVAYYIHDYSSICENIKLMYNNKYFCNAFENNWKLCISCKSGESKKIMHSYHNNLFKRKNIILISPSNSTKKIISKAFNLANERIKVIPHQQYGTKRKKG